MNSTQNALVTQSQSLGHTAAPDGFKDDLEILKSYQNFSAEILRIATLGLSALAILIFAILKDSNGIKILPSAKHALVASALLFGVSVAFALLHRYCSADAMASHLRVLRLEKVENDSRYEQKNRDSMLKYSGKTLFWGSMTLALAGLTFAIAIAQAL